ncbi:hypothetical protein DIPPA_27464 [Diplonema papillatum]|nr:hypothetical protein DIPPA_27464 [Diplonema papillatum]
MAGFFHDKLVPTYGRENIRLVYTDTDSFILQIKTGDIWKDLAEKHKHLAEEFDFSNFPKDHNLYSSCTRWDRASARSVPLTTSGG